MADRSGKPNWWAIALLFLGAAFLHTLNDKFGAINERLEVIEAALAPEATDAS